MDVDGQDVAASGGVDLQFDLARFEAPAGIVRVRFAGDHWKPARDTGVIVILIASLRWLV